MEINYAEVVRCHGVLCDFDELPPPTICPPPPRPMIGPQGLGSAAGLVWALILRTSRGSSTTSPTPVIDPAVALSISGAFCNDRKGGPKVRRPQRLLAGQTGRAECPPPPHGRAFVNWCGPMGKEGLGFGDGRRLAAGLDLTVPLGAKSRGGVPSCHSPPPRRGVPSAQKKDTEHDAGVGAKPREEAPWPGRAGDGRGGTL